MASLGAQLAYCGFGVTEHRVEQLRASPFCRRFLERSAKAAQCLREIGRLDDESIAGKILQYVLRGAANERALPSTARQRAHDDDVCTQIFCGLRNALHRATELDMDV